MGNLFGKPEGDSWGKWYSFEYPIAWALINGEWYCDDMKGEDQDFYDSYYITYKKKKKGEHIFFARARETFIPGELLPTYDKGNNLIGIWRIYSVKYLTDEFYQLKCKQLWRKAIRVPSPQKYCLGFISKEERNFWGDVPGEVLIYFCILEGKYPDFFRGRLLEFLRRVLSKVPDIISDIIITFLIL